MPDTLNTDQIIDLVHIAGHHHVVATIANCDKDPSVVVRWITGEASPTPEQTRRLLFAHEWIVKVPNRILISIWLSKQVKLEKHAGTVSVPRAIALGFNDEACAAMRNIYATY